MDESLFACLSLDFRGIRNGAAYGAAAPNATRRYSAPADADLRGDEETGVDVQRGDVSGEERGDVRGERRLETEPPEGPGERERVDSRAHRARGGRLTNDAAELVHERERRAAERPRERTMEFHAERRPLHDPSRVRANRVTEKRRGV